MRVPSSDQVSVAVHHFGGSGPPLLLSHATGFHAFCYLPIADELADQHDCSGLDYRGHGDTARPDDWAVDWDRYGDDALVVAQALAPDGGLVAFGHSMGGAALLMAAHRQPGLFSTLVLFEPIVFDPTTRPPEGGGNALAEGARRRRPTFPTFEAAIDNFASKPPFAAFHPDVTRLYVAHGFRPAPDGVRLKCDPEHEARTFECGGTHATWHLLPEIHTRTVVVAGQDGMGPATIARPVSERLPNALYIELEGGDHFTPFVDPVGTAALIADVIR